MSAIEDLRYRVLDYAKSPETKQLVQDLFTVLEKQNQFNYEARIKTGDPDVESADSQDFEYTTREYARIDDEDGCEREVHTDEITNEQDRISDVVSERDDALVEVRLFIEALIDELPELVKEFEDPEDPENRIEYDFDEPDLAVLALLGDFGTAMVEGKEVQTWWQEAQDYESELGRLERGKIDTEFEEVYWNTVWFYRNIDKDVATRLGLGVGTVTESDHTREDDEFLFLQGCGMNLEPLLVAYEALVYGYCSPEHVRQFREPDYFKHVVGEDVFKEVCQTLGISECMETAEAESKQRMADFDASIKRLTQARKEGVDETLIQIGALAAYAQTL